MNATKAQLVDYIYHNFKKDGKKILKKELNSLSLETLQRIVTRNNCEKQLEAWINRPKMIKFMVNGAQDGKDYSWDCEYPSEEECRKAFESKGVKIERIVTAANHHRCRYCSEFVEGKEKDLLCDDCRNVFDHRYYSEL